MADANVIKEFVVAIGFKIDQAGMRGVQRGIQAIANAVKTLAGWVSQALNTAAAAIKGVARVLSAGVSLVANVAGSLVGILGSAVGAVGTAIGSIGKLVGDVAGSVAKAFGTMAVAVTGTVGGLIYAVERTAQSFFHLYYAAQHVGASTQNLLGLRFAGEQVGLGTQTIEQQAANLGARMRAQPGLQMVLGGFFGVNSRDRGGRLRDTEAITMEVAKQYKAVLATGDEFKIAMANQQLQLLGLDPETMRDIAMRYDEIEKYQQEYRQRLKDVGLDTDRVSKNSKEFMQSLGDVWATVKSIWDKLVDDLLPYLKPLLKDLNDYLRAHAKEIAAYLSSTVISLIEWIKSLDWGAIKKGIHDAWDWFVNIDWKSVKENMHAVWDWLKEFPWKWLGDQINKVFDWVKNPENWKKLKKDMAPYIEDIKALKGWYDSLSKTLGIATDKLNAMTEAQKTFAEWMRHNVWEAPGRFGRWLRNKIFGGEVPDTGDQGVAGDEGGTAGAQWKEEWGKEPMPTAPQTKGGKAAEGEAIKYFMGQGYSQEQAAGLVANLVAESGLNPNAVGDSGKAYGIGQWHADRQAMFEKVFGHPIQQSTLGEQLAFVAWELKHSEAKAGELLRGAKTAREAGAIGSKYYERPGNVEGEAGKRGSWAEDINRRFAGGGAQLSSVPASALDGLKHLASFRAPTPVVPAIAQQRTSTINVSTGPVTVNASNAGNPADVGRSVRTAMDRSHADLLRNLRGADAASA